jgi:hypothetical protein
MLCGEAAGSEVVLAAPAKTPAARFVGLAPLSLTLRCAGEQIEGS